MRTEESKPALIEPAIPVPAQQTFPTPGPRELPGGPLDSGYPNVLDSGMTNEKSNRLFQPSDVIPAPEPGSISMRVGCGTFSIATRQNCKEKAVTQVFVRTMHILLAAALSTPFALADDSPAATPQVELVAIARMPADTLIPGPTSGQFIDPEQKATNFTGPPYPDAQPVQGFSAIVDEADGNFIVLADNGYGSKANSPDFVVSLYRIRPEFRTATGGAGIIHIESRIALRDPGKLLPFPRISDSEHYPDRADLQIPQGMRQRSWLTGADLDPESLQRLEGGHYWIGDEFGPWLLEFGRSGRLLSAPFAIPGYASPDNPLAVGDSNVARSGGFEGMALDRERGVLYPMLEKAVADGQGVLEIFEFDITARQFLTGDQGPVSMRYPLDDGAHAVGAFQYLGHDIFLTIERDGGQGAEAKIKRVYRVVKGQTDEKGLLRKELVVDLLNISDPQNLSGAAVNGVYSFAYETIESLVILEGNRLGVLNDNNFPFGNGPDGKDAEETVFIIIQVPGL